MSNKKETTSLQQYPYHSHNPFMEDVVNHINTVRKRKVSGLKYQEVITDGGEVRTEPMLVLGDIKEVDKQNYFKLYNGAIQEFFGLSMASMKLFDYIMNNIQYHKDKICLVVSDVMEGCSLSKSTVYRCIVNLIEAKIIAKADNISCYYINPNFAFKGDRITIVKQFVRKKQQGLIEEDDVPYGN